MKRTLLLICSLIALAFVSCDKIDESEYLIFSGASGEWYSTDVDIPAVQCAFIEKYTGVRCKNCPTADEVLHAAADKYGDRVAIAAIHCTAFAEPITNQDPDLRIEDGAVWQKEFLGDNPTLPSAMVSRIRFNNDLIFTPTASFDDRIDNILNKTPQVAMMMNSGIDDGDLFSTDVYVELLDASAKNLTLTVLLIEDDIHTTQINGSTQIPDYQQNHVLRDIITDPWGLDVNLAAKKGMVHLAFNLPEGCNADNCHLIAFVSNKENKEILNTTQCKLK